ncbi:hypothetical protein ACTFJW_08950 [Clostridium cagae]|uniref:hypothetical protein n=1 Tax=Clostridium cagae TaxID=2080751 RepID=UPI003F759D5D
MNKNKIISVLSACAITLSVYTLFTIVHTHSNTEEMKSSYEEKVVMKEKPFHRFDGTMHSGIGVKDTVKLFKGITPLVNIFEKDGKRIAPSEVKDEDKFKSELKNNPYSKEEKVISIDFTRE